MSTESILCCAELKPTTTTTREHEIHFTAFLSFAADTDEASHIAFAETAIDDTSVMDGKLFKKQLTPRKEKKTDDGKDPGYVVQCKGYAKQEDETWGWGGASRFRMA